MTYKQKRVVLDDIAEDDRTFCITTQVNVEDLSRSILAAGLINPPVLMEKEHGWLVVCGFRRIKACRNLGWDKIDAHILAPDTPGVQCANMAVSENALERPLNLVEQARALHLLCAFVGKKQLHKAALELGLHAQGAAIEQIMRLDRLYASIQDLVIKGRVGLTMALKFVDMPADEALAFARVFTDLSLNLNWQKAMLTFTREIAAREGISVMEILKETAISTVLGDDSLDVPRKSGAVRSYLRRRRFPHLAEAEAVYLRQKKELKLDPNVKLYAPPGFEGTQYRLELNFESIEDLTTRKQALEALLEDPHLRTILDR